MAVGYDKAYKLLAIQEKISNAKAKDLIDRGLVKVGDKKVMIARGEIKVDTKFSVKELAKTKVIFEDDDILVVDKPAFITADEVAKTFKDSILLNRLDKETSGVILLANWISVLSIFIIPTEIPFLTLILIIIDNMKAVFPIEGRPDISIKSPFCHP